MLLGLQEAIERGVLAEDAINEEILANFLSHHGRRFYKLPETTPTKKIVLERQGALIPVCVSNTDGSIVVGNSRAGEEVFTLHWEEA